MAEKFALYVSATGETTEQYYLDHMVDEVCCFRSETITEEVDRISPDFEGDYRIFKLTLSVEIVKEGTK